MPGLVKIGYTTSSTEDRIKQLNTTGVPTSFQLAACFLVKAPDELEKQLHELFREKRFSENREFFVGSISSLIEIAWPLILPALESASQFNEPESSSKPLSPPIEEESIHLLRVLSQRKREVGHYMFDLRDELDEPELKIVNRLATLKKNGLVKERRADKSYDSCWSITSEGVKFLFDHGLVEDYMLHPLWR